MTKRFGKNDGIFLCILFFLLLAGLAWFYFFRAALKTEQEAFAEVTVDGELYGIYPLSEEQTVEILINGAAANVLVIRGGSADMTAAVCPDKLCVHQRAVSSPGEMIVCLPHKVVVAVIGSDKAGLDAVAARPI